MSKIKVLDDLTIQKIAAGEVIEKPSSVVKELLENSIDANSKNLIIEILNGGKSYIRITDDGDGMKEEDLLLAFKRHSTSKLSVVEDLYKIYSLGFRGEALASISSVSKMEILTKTEDSISGLQGFIEDGEVKRFDTIACPKGTTMIVKDLFYNLPVRKKFLKSDLWEGNNISDLVNKIALGNYNKSFKFIRDNKTILKTRQNSTLLETIYTILGKEFSSDIIPIEYSGDVFSLRGYISNNNLYRGNRGYQYLYINGRYILNYAISKIIENQYSSLIPNNRFPGFVLYIDIDPKYIDVNIHPTKQEVKFINDVDIFGIIGSIIKKSLYNNIYAPKLELNKSKEISPSSEANKDGVSDEFKKLIIENIEENKNNSTNLNIWDEEEDISYDEIIIKDFTVLENSEEKMSFNFDTSFDDGKNKNIDGNFLEDILEESIDSSLKNSSIEYKEEKIQDILLDLQSIGRVFNTYILAESKDENKLYFIDQHAAHERILYEKLKNEFENEKINTQNLIVPDLIELNSLELNLYDQNKDLFKKLGFDIDYFGNNTIAVKGVPILFGKPDNKNLFRDIFDNLDDNIKSNYNLKVEKIMKISCTYAIKGGDKITDQEIVALFKDLRKCDNPYTCPHGRPTMIEISKKQIEKEFLRIM